MGNQKGTKRQGSQNQGQYPSKKQKREQVRQQEQSIADQTQQYSKVRLGQDNSQQFGSDNPSIVRSEN